MIEVANFYLKDVNQINYTQLGNEHPLTNSSMVKIKGDVEYAYRYNSFFEEAGYQHQTCTYLQLLDAPPVPSFDVYQNSM
jgi:hypothetical protein